MRFTFTSIDRPKRLAKNLRDLLDRHGGPKSLSACQNLLAEMLGYRDWHELADSIGVASDFDEVCTVDIVSERLQRQKSALIRAGLEGWIAGHVVLMLGATRRSRSPSLDRTVQDAFIALAKLWLDTVRSDPNQLREYATDLARLTVSIDDDDFAGAVLAVLEPQSADYITETSIVRSYLDGTLKVAQRKALVDYWLAMSAQIDRKRPDIERMHTLAEAAKLRLAQLSGADDEQAARALHERVFSAPVPEALRAAAARHSDRADRPASSRSPVLPPSNGRDYALDRMVRTVQERPTDAEGETPVVSPKLP